MFHGEDTPSGDGDDDRPWHHKVYRDIDHWSKERLEETYRDLSRQLRLHGRGDEELFRLMSRVGKNLDRAGGDAEEIARQVDEEWQDQRDAT